jgi:plastocyanin
VIIDVGNIFFFDGSCDNSDDICETTINVGDTVTWQWVGGTHDVVECGTDWSKWDGVECIGADWGSPIQNSGTYSRTFNTPGTYHYICTVHGQSQRGILIVQEAGAPPPTPTPTSAASPTATPTPTPTATPPAGPRAPITVTVDAGNNWFCNASFEDGVCDTTIQVGDTVIWNFVEGRHNATECGTNFSKWDGDDKCIGADWGSPTQRAPFTWSRTFDTTGTFYYLCTRHAEQQRGRIIVLEAVSVLPAAGSESPSPSEPTPWPLVIGFALVVASLLLAAGNVALRHSER